MRLLKDDNAISLTQSERRAFFLVYNPGVEDPENRDRVVCESADEADHLKWLFATSAAPPESENILPVAATAKDKAVWKQAAKLFGELYDHLSNRRGANG